MEYEYTNGKNKNFILLCRMLDDFLNEAVGGEKQRKQYVQYNTLEDIHDVLLIYHGKIPVACASFKAYTKDTAEVKRVFVRQEYRGKGLSKLLMRALEEKARSKGYKSLVLETGAHLAAAVALYRKIGYQIIDNYGPYKNMKESVCMRKNIACPSESN